MPRGARRREAFSLSDIPPQRLPLVDSRCGDRQCRLSLRESTRPARVNLHPRSPRRSFAERKTTLMKIVCPKCLQPIAAGDLNVLADLAVCSQCHEAFAISTLVKEGQVPADFDILDPPPGAWFE